MASTLSCSYEDPPPAYEDPDLLLPPLPQVNTPSYVSTSPPPAYEELDVTNGDSSEAPQPIYEDLDALTAAVTDGGPERSEVKPKPIPRPRSRVLLKAQCVNSNDGTSDSSTTIEVPQDAEVPPDYKRPHPVRPAPEPPVSKYLSSSRAAAPENQYTNSQPSVRPPVDYSKRKTAPPSRPPLPSIYYGRTASLRGETGTQSKVGGEACEPATYSPTSPKPDPVSSSRPEEAVKLNGTYAETGYERKPAVPPRPRPLSAPAPGCESSPTLSRAPAAPGPSTRPPPPVRDEPPYLEILPSENRTTQWRSTLRPELRQSQTSPQQNKEDTDEVIAMLRWLKKVSRPDHMTPSVYGLSLEEEIGSFEQRAANVSKALRLFNLLMMKRKDKMRKTLAEFTSISDSVDKLQKKTKTMGIAGGTTGAVGGVTAVVGIALAPVTLGASLIATAVGAGMVASAGGMGAHTAKANKKVVNRATVEKLVDEYQANVVDLEHCLDFIVSGMNELRRHDIARLQRAGAQLEAVRMAHLSQAVFTSTHGSARTPGAPTSGTSSERLLLAFSKEMDQYFTEKNSQKLKKLNKSKFSGRVRLLAQNLQDDLDHLNHMWELFT